MTQRRREIAFLKLDIGGAELSILERDAAAGLLDKVRLTLAETHTNKVTDLRAIFHLARSCDRCLSDHQVSLNWI
ncbi:hypothetical protein [uncultured Roseobacter sp.]|uniref:hypothetical protein n=1 Tax=uncultured Roseobacter sp. TaxID=114847 RepID=UPI00263587E3|nr:hypothetical protein [uncultured Roseobacter sp.]